MATTTGLLSPFVVFDRRRYREERLAAYIRREHRRGRRLEEILSDPYPSRCRGHLLESVLERADLIAALEHDVADAISHSLP